MTPKTLIGAATAAAITIGAGAAFAQQVYDPSVRKELDPYSIAADKPIFWERDARGALILDARGNPIPTTNPAYVVNPPTVSVDASTVAPAPASPTFTYSTGPSRVEVITNGPVPDTPANRARYGGPLSNAGRNTSPVGN